MLYYDYGQNPTKIRSYLIVYDAENNTANEIEITENQLLDSHMTVIDGNLVGFVDDIHDASGNAIALMSMDYEGNETTLFKTKQSVDDRGITFDKSNNLIIGYSSTKIHFFDNTGTVIKNVDFDSDQIIYLATMKTMN